MRVGSLLKIAGDTHPGLQREGNEDRWHFDAARGIFIVIDGVGGHAAGEQAADTALARLRERLERETGPVDDRIREAIAIANNEIHRLASLRPEWSGMACVLTVVVAENGRAVVGHVGDTRLYKLRHGRIEKVTRDHSPVGEREDAGELSEAAAMRHPRRNEVYRDVGSDRHEPTDPDFIDITEIGFEADSALLLCTDGLTDAVSSSTILDAAHEYGGHPYEVVRALIDAANDAGGKDNVTVVYVEGPHFASSIPSGTMQTSIRPASAEPHALPQADISGTSPRRRERRWRTVLLIISLLIVIGAAVARTVPWKVPWRGTASIAPPVLSTTGTITVAPGESIGVAIARAAAGSTVIVEPGEYREQVQLKSGVRVVSRVRRGASIRLPGGASETDAAVVAAGVRDVEFSGFRIVGDSATPLGSGLIVRDGGAAIVDVEVTGASRTAIECAGGGEVTILAADVHDNPGAALTVRSGSKPRIVHGRFRRNGTSERAPGSIVLEPGAQAAFNGNVFEGISPDAFTALTPSERQAIAKDNYFAPSDQAAPRRNARPGVPVRR